MNNQPFVSVIIIFWNAECFIAEAIESVFAQTYRAWELLLVDDGSSDGSTAIARSYAERDPRHVRYLEHPGHVNRGMSASRNLGIGNAQGAYVAFLDADDVWLSNILEEQVGILEAYPKAALVYGPIEYWYSWTGKPESCKRDYVENLGVPPNAMIEPPKIRCFAPRSVSNFPFLRLAIAGTVTDNTANPACRSGKVHARLIHCVSFSSAG
jgi:glycosyltransferase involved in cell wall biosynthesis